MGNKDFWVSYRDTPGGTAIRYEFAELIRTTEKYVVSASIAPQDLAPWQDTTRIIRGAGLYAEIAALKARPPAPRAGAVAEPAQPQRCFPEAGQRPVSSLSG
jgi:hypothetical protein